MDKKQEKEILQDFDGHTREIRQRLTEQLKCLDTRHESQLGLIADLQEYFKRRSEIEFDYARQLERLYDRFTGKQKPSHTKDMQGPSPQVCWNTVLQLTRSQYRQHTILSQVYGGTIVNSFTTSHEELQKIFKKSKELTMGVHDELMKVMSQLQKDIKTYHTWHAESKAAESRLRKTEADKQRQEEKRASGRKALEKQREKHLQRFQERKIESTKARNDYILSIEASNAALRKYFENDVTELIDCLDLGYIRSTRRTFRAFLTAEMQMKEMREDGITKMTDCVNSLNALNDKQLFMESNSSAFVPPQTFHFQPHGGDEIHQVSAQDPLHKDLSERFHRQEGRLKEVRAESEEILKTLNELKRNWEGDDNRSRFKDEEVRTAFKTAQDMEIPIEFKRTPSMRRPPKPTDTENFFLDKYKEYLKNTNIETRLQARYDLITKALGHDTSGSIPLCIPPKPRRPRPMSRCGAPLFAGDLHKYIAASGQDIPVVVLSCIDHIRDCGLHHQGIFRVGGSQSEINDIKSAFEKGEDPLPERGESADINSVASVLKLYFRELPEPLFPTFMFKQFMECMDSGTTAPSERTSMVKNLIEQLPHDIMIVMRYLFAFLKHLSQYSDENMMDSHNLAICFGPTLMPTPPNVDTLCYQGPINELIGTIIRYQENIFPRDSGRIYEEHGLNDADISPSPSLDTITDLGSEFGDEVNSVRHFDVHNHLNDHHYQQHNQADQCPIVNQHQNAEADSSTGHVGHQGPDISPWLPRRPSGPLRSLSDSSNPLDVVIEEPKTAENKPENSYKHMVQEIDDKMANNLAELDEIPEIPPPTHTPDIVRDAIKAPIKAVSPPTTPTTPTLPKPAIRPKPVRPLPNQSSSLSRHRPSTTGGPNKSMTL